MRFVWQIVLVTGGLFLLITNSVLYPIRQKPSEAYWFVDVGNSQDAHFGALYRMASDGSKRRLISTDLMLAMFETVAWSPNGDWIFYLQPLTGNRYQLWRVHPSGFRHDLFAENVYWNRLMFPFQFSPDGNALIYVGDQASGDSLYVVDTDSGQSISIMAQGELVAFAWSADGEWIYYSYRHLDDPADVQYTSRVRRDGSQMESVDDQAFLQSVWDEGGNWLAVVPNNLLGATFRLRVENSTPSEHNFYPLTWLANGWLLVVLEPGTPFHTIYRMRPDGSGLVALVDGVVPTTAFAWWAGSDWVMVMAGNNETQALYRVNVNSLEKHPITLLPGAAFLQGGWTSNRESIIFITYQNRRYTLYRMERESGILRRLARLPAGEIDPQISLTPDGNWVIVSTLDETSFERRRMRLDLQSGEIQALPAGDLPVSSPTYSLPWKPELGWGVGAATLLAAIILRQRGNQRLRRVRPAHPPAVHR